MSNFAKCRQFICSFAYCFDLFRFILVHILLQNIGIIKISFNMQRGSCGTLDRAGPRGKKIMQISDIQNSITFAFFNRNTHIYIIIYKYKIIYI